MANNRWCRHYTGTVNPTCALGIEYNSVRDASMRPYRYPCTDPDERHLCAQFEPWTQAEIDADNAKIAEFISKLNAFDTGETKVCPTCGAPVTGVRLYAKIEPKVFSLYILPCNHRQGLWGKVPDWVIADGLPVEVIESNF